MGRRGNFQWSLLNMLNTPFECIREPFPQHIPRAVNVSINVCAIRAPEQPPVPFTKVLVFVVMTYFFIIEETTLGCVRFFDNVGLNADHLRLVLQLVYQHAVRYTDKVLIVGPSQRNCLFPVGVFANYQRTYLMF